MKLTSTETDLVGNWMFQTGRMVRDPVEDRIEQLIHGHLHRIAVSPIVGAWEALYLDPSDGRLWELTYPQSHMHGGGPRRLAVIGLEAACEKYGQTVKDSRNATRTDR